MGKIHSEGELGACPRAVSILDKEFCNHILNMGLEFYERILAVLNSASMESNSQLNITPETSNPKYVLSHGR
jgi:hypothetical protein